MAAPGLKKINTDDLKRILKSLNTSYQVDKLSNEEDLFAYGALDSLIMIQFVLSIENELNIRLENDDITYDQFKTFQLIKDLLNSKYL